MIILEIIPSARIKHATGTTDSSLVWLDYWEERSNEDVSKYKYWKCECCGKDVPINKLVGSHVVKVDDPDETIYIYPTCDTCNKTYKETKADTKEFSVPETLLVPAP